MSSGNCGATCLVALLSYVKIQHRRIGISYPQTEIKKEPSYNVSVSAFLSCATNEALTASPKDPTSERTSSFLGQSLRFARGNLLALFECQTLYVCHLMVSAKKCFVKLFESCEILSVYKLNESARLRALRAKNVLTCQRALRTYVPMCLACLCAHVLTCLPCSRANVLCVLTSQCASFDVTIFSSAAIVAEVAHTVDKI